MEILNELKKEIEINYGKRCKDRDVLCPVCQLYDAYDFIEANLEFITEGKNGKKMSKG